MKRNLENGLSTSSKRTCHTQSKIRLTESQGVVAVEGVLPKGMGDPIVKEALDKGLLVAVRTQTEMLLNCIVCNSELKGAVPAAAHLVGSKHQKAYKRYLTKKCEDSGICVLEDARHRNQFVDNGAPQELKVLVQQGILEEFVRNGYLHYRCTLCCAEMSGTVPTKGHIDGSAHNKKVKVAMLTNSSVSSSLVTTTLHTSSSAVSSNSSSLSSTPPRDSLADLDSRHSTPTVPRFDLDDSSSAGSDCSLLLPESIARGVLRKVTVMGALHYECTVCGVSVSGDIPAVTHLQGKNHKKVLSRKGLQRDPLRLVPASSSSSLSSTHTTTNGDSCSADIFGVTDSISVINLNGDDETRRVTAALSAGVLARELFDGNEFYKCNVCESASRMGGPATAASHLVGQRHLKNVTRENLASSAATVTGNNISSVASNTLAKALREGELHREASGGLHCRVCKISVSGERSAEQHLLGGPHIQRLLKWREKANLSRNGINSDDHSNNCSTSLLSSEVTERTLDALLQDALEQYVIHRSSQVGDVVDATEVTDHLISRLNTKNGRTELREQNNVRIELDGRSLVFQCTACSVSIGEHLYELVPHLLSDDHQRAVAKAEDSAFHDASSSFLVGGSSTNHSSNSSRSRVEETLPESEDKIVHIGLDSEVDWDI